MKPTIASTTSATKRPFFKSRKKCVPRVLQIRTLVRQDESRSTRNLGVLMSTGLVKNQRPHCSNCPSQGPPAPLRKKQLECTCGTTARTSSRAEGQVALTEVAATMTQCSRWSNLSGRCWSAGSARVDDKEKCVRKKWSKVETDSFDVFVHPN